MGHLHQLCYMPLLIDRNEWASLSVCTRLCFTTTAPHFNITSERLPHKSLIQLCIAVNYTCTSGMLFMCSVKRSVKRRLMITSLPAVYICKWRVSSRDHSKQYFCNLQLEASYSLSGTATSGFWVTQSTYEHSFLLLYSSEECCISQTERSWERLIPTWRTWW